MNRRTPWILGLACFALAACSSGRPPPLQENFDGSFDGSRMDGSGDGTAHGDGTAVEGGMTDAMATDVIQVCDNGFTACGSNCVGLVDDPHNCGGCGIVCPAGANQVGTCTMGACGTPVCLPNFGDCDGMSANGCETVLTTPTNCGECRVVCSAPTPVCTRTSGVADGGTMDGGVADAGTATYSCATSCLEAGTTGCGEMCVNLQNDTSNCGSCGHTCTATTGSMATCIMGVCGLTCGSGFSLCGGDGGAAMCIETDMDPNNCGGCGTTCPTYLNYTASCMTSMCGGACDSLWGNCDMTLTTNGCNISLATDLDNCGSCGNVCRPTNGTGTCSMGICNVVCNPGYYRVSNTCVPIPPPRLVGPISGAIVTSRRPVLSWQTNAVATVYRIEIASDRLFTPTSIVATSYSGGGHSITPSADLPTGVTFWRVEGGIGGSFGSTPSAVWEFVVGGRSSSPAQSSWGAFFDANGDGLEDVAVGAPGSDGVYVFNGATTTVVTSPSYSLMSSGMAFGSVVASAGGVNGDGYSDFLVGAPAAHQVFAYLGSSVGLVPTASVTLSGGTNFGISVSPCQDINGDGFGDVIIGDPGEGAVRVYTGTSAGITTGSPTSFIVLNAPTTVTSGFGTSVAGLGDTNGDGFPDVAVGSPSDNAAYIYTGAMISGGSTLSSAVVTRIAGPLGSTGFGTTLSSAGDVNGDGFMDLVVGAPGSGGVYVYYGAMTGIATSPSATLTGPTGVSYGWVVQGVGDVDGDGFDDVAVGTLGTNAILVFHGGASGIDTTADDMIPAPSGTGASGLSISGAILGANAFRSSILFGDSSSNRVFGFLPGASTINITPGLTLSQSSGQFGAAVYGAFR